LIAVWCPCGAVYSDSWRASVNLSLDDFDQEYVDRMSSTRCPECRINASLGAVVSRFEEHGLSIQIQTVSGPTPIILYRERQLFEQPKAHGLIKQWLASEARSGVEKLVRIIEETRSPLVPDWPRDDSLREIVLDWMVLNKTQEHELWNRVVCNRQSDQAPE
jgi:hypothetical protein